MVIKKLVQHSNLEDKVIFTGTVNNVHEYLKKMDIFLLPSRFEGQPYSVIEALASGLPVLISDTVSKEIHITGEMKFISIENTSKWIKEINEFDYEKYRTIRNKESLENINALRENGYDLETNVNDMLKLYNKFIQDK